MHVITVFCMLMCLPGRFILCLGLEKFLRTKIYLIKLNGLCCLYDVVQILRECLLVCILDGSAFKFICNSSFNVALIIAALAWLRNVLCW